MVRILNHAPVLDRHEGCLLDMPGFMCFFKPSTLKLEGLKWPNRMGVWTILTELSFALC